MFRYASLVNNWNIYINLRLCTEGSPDAGHAACIITLGLEIVRYLEERLARKGYNSPVCMRLKLCEGVGVAC